MNKIDYIITSRLDNDDVIHRDFIRTVQEKFVPQNDMFLNFDNGYQYDEQRKDMYFCFYKNNHYVSRIEKSGSHATVLCHHGRINEYAQVQYIETPVPLWIEIVHQHNVVNTVRVSYCTFIFKSRFKKLYGIDTYCSFENFVINRIIREKRKFKKAFPILFNCIRKVLKK